MLGRIVREAGRYCLEVWEVLWTTLGSIDIDTNYLSVPCLVPQRDPILKMVPPSDPTVWGPTSAHYDSDVLVRQIWKIDYVSQLYVKSFWLEYSCNKFDIRIKFDTGINVFITWSLFLAFGDEYFRK